MQDCLGGWIFVLKDSLKRALIVFEETDLLLGSVRFLENYEPLRDRREAMRNPLFASLAPALENELRSLRTLREALREELHVVQLLFGEQPYDELVGRPAGDELVDRYKWALDTLSTTSADEVLVAFAEDVRSMLENEDDERYSAFKDDFADLIEAIDGPFWELVGEQLVRLQEEAVFQTNWLETYDVRDMLSLDLQIRDWFRPLGEVYLARIRGSLGRGGPTFLRRLFTKPGRNWGARRALLAQTIISTAERCARGRKDRVLRRVARYQVHGSVAVRSDDPHPIHEDLFRSIRTNHVRLKEALGRLHSLVRAARQRAAVLPPNFPSVPSFHRRERERVSGALVELLEVLTRRTSTMLDAFGLLPRSVRSEISLAYVFSSEVREVQVLDHEVLTILDVPFFFIELPKHFVNVAHELAHTCFSWRVIDELVDRSKDGSSEAPARLRRAVQTAHVDLSNEYAWSGTWQMRHSPHAVIAEVLSDFVALCVTGPHFVYSLAFTTLGLVRVPVGEPAIAAAPTNINPIVRLEILIRTIPRLLGDRPRETGWWDPNRLKPIQSIVRSYFALLAGNPDAKAAEELFRREVELLSEMITSIVGWLETSGGLSSIVRPWHDTATVEAARTVSAELSDLRRLLELPEQPKDRTPDSEADGFVAAAAEPDRGSADAVARENALHVLWDWTLSIHEWSARDFVEAALIGDDDRRRTSLERLLWTRSPEVRPLLYLLDRPSGLRATRRSDIVTVWEVRALWRGQNARTGWYEFPLPSTGRHVSWVLGDHDLRLVTSRFQGPEDLDRELVRVRSLMPIEPRHHYVRALDYEVLDDGRKDMKRPDVSATFRLRAAELVPATIDAAIDNDEVWRGGLHRSFGWDQYVVEVGFASFRHLAQMEERLVQRSGTRHRSIAVTHPVRPGAALEPEKALEVISSLARPRGKGTDGRIEVVTRLRAAAPKAGEYANFPVRRSDALSLALSVVTGIDSFELRLVVEGIQGGDDYLSKLFNAYVCLVDHAVSALDAYEAQTALVLPS